MTLKTVYDLTLSVLSPLHIGSGETLERDFDYAVHKKRTWVLDADAIAAAYLFDDNGRYLPQLQTTPPAKLLRPDDFQPDSSFFRYVMPGTPWAKTTGSALKTHIKHIDNRPYIPGSSLKGALRTIIFRAAYADRKPPLNPAALGKNRAWAAQRLERDLLGKNPNYDLMRALHVSDSQPIAAGDNLLLLHAQVFTRQQAGAPIALECIRGDAELTTTLAIDDYLFQDEQAQRILGFTRQQESWLRQLAELANQQAEQRIRQELSHLQDRPKDGATRLYRQLAGLVRQMPSNAFLLQLGWGGGWDSKTAAYLLSPGEKDAVVQRYRLAKGQRQPGRPFPASRRAISRSPGNGATMAAPLGWLLVQMTART